MRQYKLDEVSRKLNQEKNNLMNMLPQHLQSDFAKEAYISGGCIYSLYNDKEPKDYDFFIQSETFTKRLRDYFMDFLPLDGRIELETGISNIKVFHSKGHRVVLTKNAISIGKYQIITKFFGEPTQVVGQFDFMHNTYWYKKDKVEPLSNWDFLDSNALVYNEQRARDISGTIIRVSRFVARGMTITNAEMSKMLKKLREVGFTDRENEIIDQATSY